MCTVRVLLSSLPPPDRASVLQKEFNHLDIANTFVGGYTLVAPIEEIKFSKAFFMPMDEAMNLLWLSTNKCWTN